MALNRKLPSTALRKLEQCLAQWRQWQGADELPGAPHLVAQLGGISNYTVLAEAAGQRFCVRLDRVNPAANGLNRQVEWRALQRAHQAGIAPRPRYFNPEIGALVCDYLPPDEDQTIAPESLAKLLRAIHQLPGLHYRLDLAERIRRYHRQLRNLQPGVSGALEELNELAMQILQEVIAAPANNCLCHNDLSSDNLLRSGGRLYALDWEYCAMGNPWFDLATSHLNSGLEPGHQDDLLRYYLQGPVTRRDRALLEHWIHLVRQLELLWYLSQRPDYLSEKTVQHKLAELLSYARRVQ